MNNPKWAGLGRHLITLLGTVLVAFGVGNEDLITQTGDLIFIIGGSVLDIFAMWKSQAAPEKQITNAQYQALKSAK